MNEKRQPVSIRKLLIGTVMGIGILIMSAGMLESFVQGVLFIPDLLGLVKHVTPENTIEYSEPGTYIINNLGKGDYLIYDCQFFLDVKLTSLTTGQTIAVQEFLVEGERLNPRIFEFTIPASGDYEITVPDSLQIIPNFSKNMDTVFVLGLIIQPLLIYSLYHAIYRWRNRKKIAANQKFRDTRSEKFDDWFKKVKEKKNS